MILMDKTTRSECHNCGSPDLIYDDYIEQVSYFRRSHLVRAIICPVCKAYIYFSTKPVEELNDILQHTKVCGFQ